MKRSEKISKTSNSGSMAYIAFLLLIFLLVATTSLQEEKSIPMKLLSAYDGPIGGASHSKLLAI